MLIRNLRVSGLLSFGPEGIDLPLSDLNVLIGPNGSGKSNLLEILSILRALPRDLSDVLKGAGGIGEWFYKRKTDPSMAEIKVQMPYGSKQSIRRHELSLTRYGNRYEINLERISTSVPTKTKLAWATRYEYSEEKATVRDRMGTSRQIELGRALERESILSQIKDPEGRYPSVTALQTTYESIRVFRNWQFGPAAAVRQEQPSDARNDFLSDGGENLVLVINKLVKRVKRDLLSNLNELYPNITDINADVDNGAVQLFLEEGEGRWIPASRLSDGTLRYLCLLAILLHPDPPSLVALEEPELGLHPDIVPHVGKLIKAASKRMQIVMTTHSQVLLDVFTDSPEDVIVCSRGKDGSQMERLSAKKLAHWLEEHSLGELWNLGEIGGTRW